MKQSFVGVSSQTEAETRARESDTQTHPQRNLSHCPQKHPQNLQRTQNGETPDGGDREEQV